MYLIGKIAYKVPNIAAWYLLGLLSYIIPSIVHYKMNCNNSRFPAPGNVLQLFQKTSSLYCLKCIYMG